MDPSTTQTLVYAVGGIVGAGLKSVISNSQEIQSKKTVVDLCIGAAVGILYPLFPTADIVPIPKDANLIQQGVFIAGISYVAGHAIMSGVLTRLQSTNALLKPSATPPTTTTPPKS